MGLYKQEDSLFYAVEDAESTNTVASTNVQLPNSFHRHEREMDTAKALIDSWRCHGPQGQRVDRAARQVLLVCRFVYSAQGFGSEDATRPPRQARDQREGLPVGSPRRIPGGRASLTVPDKALHRSGRFQRTVVPSPLSADSSLPWRSSMLPSMTHRHICQ